MKRHAPGTICSNDFWCDWISLHGHWAVCPILPAADLVSSDGPCNDAEVVKYCGWQILSTDPQTQSLSFFFCIPLLPFPSCSSFPVTSTDYVPFICHLSCPLPSSISVLFSLYVVLGFPLIGVCWPANLFVLYHHLYQSIIIFCPSISFLFLLLLRLFMVSWHLLFSSQFSFSFSHLSLWCSSGFTVSLNSGLGIQFCEKYWSGSFTLKGKG